MIKKLKLKNFRKFQNLELDCNSKIVVLIGDNAQGKSSILEAIHIVCNGKSPWSTNGEYIKNNQEDIEKFSRVEMEIDDKKYAHYKENNRKIYSIDERKTNSKKFFEKNSVTIFNPEKIDILMLSPSRRRDFLDETIAQIDYEYPSIINEFRKILRQRNSYLKKLSKQFFEKGIIARNDTQLDFWSRKLIETSTQIYERRLPLIKRFEEKDFRLEYNFCDKDLDDIRNKKEEEKNVILEKVIEKSKKKDIATGYSNIGPHRDDWNIFTNQDIKKYGSRGQKRLAVGNLIFKAHEIIADELGKYPILLLDDIASELDYKNTKEIFDKKILEKQQTFITTIQKDILPKYILEEGLFINLNDF